MVYLSIEEGRIKQMFWGYVQGNSLNNCIWSKEKYADMMDVSYYEKMVRSLDYSFWDKELLN